MGIVVIGAIFVDIKGIPLDTYVPTGKNAGKVEYLHGGVTRNIAEDIGKISLKPTLLSIVDYSALGQEVIERLNQQKVNTQYIQKRENGMGLWLAVFSETGDVAGSISQRPNLMPIYEMIKEKGNEIFKYCDSIIIEADIDQEIVEEVLKYAKKYKKKVFGVISNMHIAKERKHLLKDFDCLVCNELEAGVLFDEDYSNKSPDELCSIIKEKVEIQSICSMVVTMGSLGSVYASKEGTSGTCPAQKVIVKDTTGAGDAFGAGLAVGLTYGKTFDQSIKIGTKLASTVITSLENVCPHFSPKDFNLKI